MKSPANFGELDGTTRFESGSASARVNCLPAFEPFIPVAVALSAKNGAVEAVLAEEFSVTTYTAAADAGALPPLPRAEALTSIFPPATPTAALPPLGGS